MLLGILFFAFASISRASELIQRAQELSSSQEQVQQDPFYVLDSELGTFKNFGKKYLTLKVPESRESANKLSSRLREFMKAISSKIWDLDACYERTDICGYFSKIFTIFREFRRQSVRRALIYGIINRLKHVERYYKSESKKWRLFGSTVVDILNVINELIPEDYLESGLLPEDSGNFADKMSEFVALSWKIDFYPLFRYLKMINYVSIGDAKPLKYLVRKGDFLLALKMILSKDVSLNPEICLDSWNIFVHVPETDEKIQFVSNLLRLNLFNVNWRIRQGEGVEDLDLITMALKSELEHYKMIILLLSGEIQRLDRPLTFYLSYINDPLVSSSYSETYRGRLVDGISSLISRSSTENGINNP